MEEEEKPKKGSLNWYRLKGKFFKYLSFAIMHADDENTSKLGRIFPHLVKSYYVRWDEDPGNGDTIVENTDTDIEIPKNRFLVYNMGSFCRYLHQSNHFDTYLSKAIVFADKKNLSLIKEEYPLITAAHAMENWEEPPDLWTKKN